MTTLLRLRAMAVGIAVSSTLLAGSCGSTKQPVTAAPAAPTSPQASATAGGGLTEDQRERMALIPPVKVAWDKAADTAVGEVPTGRLVEIELTASRAAPAGTASGSPSPAGSAPPARMPVWDVTVAAEDGTVHDVQV